MSAMVLLLDFLPGQHHGKVEADRGQPQSAKHRKLGWVHLLPEALCCALLALRFGGGSAIYDIPSIFRSGLRGPLV